MTDCIWIRGGKVEKVYKEGLFDLAPPSSFPVPSSSTQFSVTQYPVFSLQFQFSDSLQSSRTKIVQPVIL